MKLRWAIAGALLLVSGYQLQSASAVDYRDDIGYFQLSSELGDLTPSGAGIHFTHVEALSDNKWMPNTADGQFTGKQFFDQSTEHPDGYSGHANGVGGLLYGNALSIAKGVTEIDTYVAGLNESYPDPWPPYPPPWQWLQRGFLWAGWLVNGKPVQPIYGMPEYPNCRSADKASPSRLANHSWVASINNSDLLRRIDWVIDTDEFIQVVASHTSSALMSAAFNVIAVGRTSGEAATGTPALDADYPAGRTRPHLVAPQSTLSSATPIVASAGAILLETGRRPELSTDPAVSSTTNRDGDIIWNAERSEVIKAALMAGADRYTANEITTDEITAYRQQTGDQSDNGLDLRYGAGQVNTYNSYHILAAGEQNAAAEGTCAPVGWRGFDYQPSFGISGGQPQTACYAFTTDAAHSRLAAALVWNLKIDGGTCANFNSSAIFFDFNLSLDDVTDPENPIPLAVSDSSNENTENLWIALPAGRQYRISVSAAPGQGEFQWDYALAWQVIADGDRDTMPDGWELTHGLNPDDPADAVLDPDQDDLANAQEFITGTDPNEADSDSDGVLDGAEKTFWVDHFGTWLDDYDGDGQANNLLDADADGDGALDGVEILQGTDPSDPLDSPAAIAVPALGPIGLMAAAFLLAGLVRSIHLRIPSSRISINCRLG
ncbi:MAG: hypothetical protein ABIL58_21325 [Pseudomonadota bacterium]